MSWGYFKYLRTGLRGEGMSPPVNNMEGVILEADLLSPFKPKMTKDLVMSEM